ncbi:alkaline phosphatase family protein [Salinisphaera sp. T31B1]|uniref:alkaline phosphatase family protein n=1 Tax=Salinisphaera sp. T31B1 TaxID=727963 RepID=UPI0033419346
MTIAIDSRRQSGQARLWALSACMVTVLLAGCAWQAAQFWVAGDQVALRETDADERPAPRKAPQLLIVAIDGIDRHLLYDMLEAAELPEMAALLGGTQDGELAHAYLQDSMVSVLPSSTGVSWATMITGRNPAESGVTGNEYFIRDTGQYAAPVPVTIHDATPVFEIYNDGYANKLLEVPTIYERMRKTDPGVRVWVGMHQYYSGADRLILTDRTAMLDAFQSLFAKHVTDRLTGEQSLSLFRELDQEVIENMSDLLEDEPAADVITIYLPGLDHYAHIHDADPDTSRRDYLQKGLEPMMKELRETLDEVGALDDRYVVLTSDHGHTGVLHDDEHSLDIAAAGEPDQVLEKAGFTLRPYELEIDDDVFFDAVLAYQGALAYVYLADRTTCPTHESPCDWTQPARGPDIKSAAEALYRNNEDGLLVPEMRGALDMILVRTGQSDGAEADVFEVYTGHGQTQPVADYLAANPHPSYVDMPQRLRDLTIGPYGDRAGDIILVAHNGDRDDVAQRYYFAPLYHSWHGSPSHRDSDIPLIVAHRDRTTGQLKQTVEGVLNGGHEQRLIADLLVAIRAGQAPGTESADSDAGR